MACTSRFPPPSVEVCSVGSPRAGRVFEWAITQPIVRDDPWHHIVQLCIRARTSARTFAAATCCARPRALPQVPQHFDGARANGSLIAPQDALISFASYGADCRFQQRYCSRKDTDENFKITLEVLQAPNPKFLSNSVSALCKHCEGWLQCIASVMQGILTLQNHSCKNLNRPLHFARIWEIKLPNVVVNNVKQLKSCRQGFSCLILCQFIL